jgi:putative NADH-flavin reductase
MNILLLGASGKCGRWVHRLAAEQGHTLTAIVRPQSVHKLTHPATIIEGEVLDAELLTDAASGKDAIISTLGLNRKSIIPWSRLQSPPDLVQRVTRTLATIAQAPDAPRIVWLSAGGAGHTRSQTGPFVRIMIGLANVGVAYRDLTAAESIVESSNADIITVRPVTLTNSARERRAKPIDRYRIHHTVSRRAVAQWMLDRAELADRVSNHPSMINA